MKKWMPKIKCLFFGHKWELAEYKAFKHLGVFKRTSICKRCGETLEEYLHL